MTPSDLKQSDGRLYRSWAEWKRDVDKLNEDYRFYMEEEMNSDWIPVSALLPDESSFGNTNIVLAYFNWRRSGPLTSAAIQFAEISNGHWRPIGGNGNFDRYVTHWMPLPDAPNEKV